MTNTPRSRRLAGLATGFGVVVAAPMIGVLLTLPVPPPGTASADCALGFIDNPATPGQCVPIPGEEQQRSTPESTTAPGDHVADNANGSDLSACDLNQPYQNTVCPGAPATPDETTNVDGSTDVTAPVPGNNTSAPDLSACDLAQPYQNPLCPGAPPR